MSLRHWTPGSAADTILATWLLLVARNGCADAEANQQLQVMHPTWRQLCQSPNVTYNCYCTFGVVIHWFYSIETTMDLDQPPNMVNHLVFCNHFMKHIMVYMAPDQTVKTVAKFLWQGYISIFRQLTKLLSEWGANFVNNIIRELCELMDIRKVRTSPYHAQTNGQVEGAHQMLTHMIGKLSKDQKADWPRHLPELVHVYNSTRLAITRYSQHYLMSGHQLCLPIDFYFPMIRGTKNTSMLTTMMPSYVNDCGKPLKRLMCSPHQRQRDRNGTTIGKLMPFHWNKVA